MNKPQIPISFFIPQHLWPKNEVPKDPDESWAGFCFGIYVWTIQTYLRLIRCGIECNLISHVPDEGG